MSKLAEISLAHHLINTESLEYLVAEGLDGELIPTVPIREMVGWALSYFAQNGFRVAPTYEVMREEFGDRLDDQEIDLEDEPTSSIEWAVEALKESHVRQHSQEWARNFVTDVSTAGPGDSTVEILASHTQKLLGFSTSLESQVYRVEGDEGLMTALRLFEDRANDLQDVRGLRLGFPVIDSYTHGIHRGELAVLAAGPKTGKSFALAFSALNEWRAGHDVVLVTLENSIAMTWDRIACMATNISYLDWQEGTSLPDEVELVREFHRSVAESPTKFVVIQPPLGRRNFDSMVAEARIYKAQALFIDQLTFVEMPDPRKAKTERIGDALHQLKGLISDGRTRSSHPSPSSDRRRPATSSHDTRLWSGCAASNPGSPNRAGSACHAATVSSHSVNSAFPARVSRSAAATSKARTAAPARFSPAIATPYTHRTTVLTLNRGRRPASRS